jgi:hypothetical protein
VHIRVWKPDHLAHFSTYRDGHILRYTPSLYIIISELYDATVTLV